MPTNVLPTARPPRLQHILVPYDFSEGAKLALQHALAQARQFQSFYTWSTSRCVESIWERANRTAWKVRS